MSFLSVAKRLRTRFAASWQDDDEEDEAGKAEPPLVETEDAPPSAPLPSEGEQEVTTERMDHQHWEQQPSVVIEQRWIAR